MIYAIVAAILLAVGFGSGWSVHNWKSEAEKVAAILAAEAARDAETKRANDIAARFEGKLDKLRVVNRTYYNETRHETEKTVYRDCVVPATGVGLLNRAVDSANGATAQPDGAMPKAAAGK